MKKNLKTVKVSLIFHPVKAYALKKAKNSDMVFLKRAGVKLCFYILVGLEKKFRWRKKIHKDRSSNSKKFFSKGPIKNWNPWVGKAA